jgi:P27 family predicted phage terminase small subunit
MKPGPPPKPSGLRIIEGTDQRGRSGRQLDRTREPVAPAGPLEPPYELAPEVREVWDRVAAILKEMKLASPSDVDALAVYCEAIIVHRKASQLIAKTAILMKGSRSWVINGAVRVQRDAAMQIIRCANEFGLTPSARARVEAEPISRSYENPFAGSPRTRNNPFAG